MLRLQRQGSPEELSRLHHQDDAKPADPQHRLGQELSIYVGAVQLRTTVAQRLTRRRELFGTSEDDAPELDHTENQENGGAAFLQMTGEEHGADGQQPTRLKRCDENHKL